MTTTARSHLTPAPSPDAELSPSAWLGVQQALARYAYALDQHDPASLAAVLTDDATWTFTVAGAAGPGPFTGRAAILDFVRAATETATDQRRHHLTNIVFSGADADTVTANAYLMLTSDAGGSPSVIATGFYSFSLERSGTQWQIARLLLDMDANR